MVSMLRWLVPLTLLGLATTWSAVASAKEAVEADAKPFPYPLALEAPKPKP